MSACGSEECARTRVCVSVSVRACVSECVETASSLVLELEPASVALLSLLAPSHAHMHTYIHFQQAVGVRGEGFTLSVKVSAAN